MLVTHWVPWIYESPPLEGADSRTKPEAELCPLCQKPLRAGTKVALNPLGELVAMFVAKPLSAAYVMCSECAESRNKTANLEWRTNRATQIEAHHRWWWQRRKD